MRNILHLLAALLVAASPAFSQEEVAPAAVVETGSGVARLGLGVSKPDDTTTTQLPSLPPGIGFVVSELEEGGPAEKAGVRKLDLLWKMGEQMLVNEGQLATLLRLSKPGDEVTVSVFRQGKSLDITVTLGEAEGDDGEVIQRVLADSVLRSEDGALRIVNLGEKRALYSNEKGSAEVIRVSEGDSVSILDPGGNVVFEGVLRGKPEFSEVPDGWRRQICAMRRGLDHALSAKQVPHVRQPRPRIVAPTVKE
jgi:hypothetical protein